MCLRIGECRELKIYTTLLYTDAQELIAQDCKEIEFMMRKLLEE